VGVITIVTHAAMPDGPRDDRLLAQALAARGAETRLCVWDDPDVDWAKSALTVVRSTWDYHRHPRAWFDWLDCVAGMTRLINPAGVLRWNSRKSYLLALAERGVEIVPTLRIEAGPLDLAVECRARGWDDIVVKPEMGASAHGARRFAGPAIHEADAHAAALLEQGGLLVQPYQASVETERERSIVLIDGVFSHAFVKPAFMTGLGDADGLERIEIDAAQLAFARYAFAQAPDDPVYARVDILPTPDGLRLMELEMIEPQLAFQLCPPALDSFVEAIMSRLS
jgi:glutathione synthase/RimK-type ligase-like ATP-grasp enzyme